MEKAHILGLLGEHTLLLPSLVNMALAANDRIKYRLTLLQSAHFHANHPEAPMPNLRMERLAAGVLESTLDQVIAGAQPLDAERVLIPESAHMLSELHNDVMEMYAPLEAAKVRSAAAFAKRLEQLSFPEGLDNALTANDIRALTSGERREGDSLHLIVMDMHQALNALQTTIAAETINGCQAYGIQESDRDLIAAFMSGVSRTAPLKFDHPGLATTATHIRDQLVLQNDIGATDAHVLVVHVKGHSATVTYTDIHLPRLLFFQSLFRAYNIEWSETRSRNDSSFAKGLYHLCVGHFKSRSTAKLHSYLEHLGASLVYLIDWNRARKRLRLFVSRNAAFDLLKWAAEHDIGHMGWLKAGGEQLIFDSMRFAFAGQASVGERLDSLLGEQRAVDFLRFTLTKTFGGLRQGRSPSLITDEIRTELASLVRSSEDALLDTAIEQAGLIVELADTVRSGLIAAQTGQPDNLLAMAKKAKKWETTADQELNSVRSPVIRGDHFMLNLMDAADNVADELEEAAFHLTLSPKASNTATESLLHLVEHVSDQSRELVKALAASRYAHRGSQRTDMEDFLQAVHTITALEHASDLAEREVKRALSLGSQTFSEIFGIAEAVRNLEGASDGLTHVAMLLHDHIMGKLGHE